MDPAEIARRTIPLIDLTSLGADDTDDKIDALCASAATHRTVAVCVYPAFVARAAERLAATDVVVATVVNFPHGGEDIDAVLAETSAAIADGADEIDLVIPLAPFERDDPDAARTMVDAVRAETGDRPLKVILETGRLAAPERIRAAADVAVRAGADFLKTSTGKIDVGATPEAAAILLDTIAASDEPVGIKLSGGIRTTADAAAYLALIDERMGAGWVSPATVRFGASSLLDDLLSPN